jgi:hypothetical protein
MSSCWKCRKVIEIENKMSQQPVLRIRDVYPGSDFFSIPDPRSRVDKTPEPKSASKILRIFNPKTV